MPPPPPHPDAIADCVLNAFHALPPKFRPRTALRNNGRHEWVTLAGIVLSREQTLPPPSPTPRPPKHDGDADLPSTPPPPSPPRLTCAVLATGMKCLPHDKVRRARGAVLHDSHAEVLALRGFNRWVVDSCAELARRGGREVGDPGGQEGEGEWVRWRSVRRGRRAGLQEEEVEEGGGGSAQGDGQQQPFGLREGVTIHMYCSEAPCGDASMELTMAEQADATPWAYPSPAPVDPPTSADDPDQVRQDSSSRELLGRAHFSRLGVVRRKPARPDAPPSRSKSCSDKLALKQCTGLLSALTARLLWPGNVYLSTLVLPASQLVPGACARAFGRTGRMAAVATSTSEEVRRRWEGAGFAFRPFEVRGTSREFAFSKRAIAAATSAPGEGGAEGAVPSNISILCTPTRHEVLINGVLQGRKQFDPKGASCASRRAMWAGLADVAALIDGEDAGAALRRGSYAEVKAGEAGEGREMMKRHVRGTALPGWVKNDGDDDWRLGDEQSA